MSRTRAPGEGPHPAPPASVSIPPTDADGEEESRRRRVEALSALAGSAAAERPTTPDTDGPSLRRRLALLGLLLAVVAAAGGAGVYLARREQPAHPTTQAPKGPLAVDLSALGFACPSNAAWSPDGGRLAVLAHAGGGCGTQTLAIVALDARTGHELAARPLDTADEGLIFAWTPDGSAIAYQQYVPGATAGEVVPTLVIWPLAGAPRTIRAAPHALALAGYFVWDLRQGTLIGTPAEDLPAALAYRWTADGSIVPDKAAVPAAHGAGYTGSPTTTSGAATFSRWQPGAIVPITPGIGQPPTAQTYQSVTDLWSPDGRYLATRVSLRAELAAPDGGPAPALPDGVCRFAANRVLCAAGPLASPDAAFAAIRAAADGGTHLAGSQGQGTGPTQWDPVSVAWRPDGKVVAAILPDQGFDGANARVQVSLYRTADATLIGTVSVDHPHGSGWLQGVVAPLTFWSPNGDRLALLDYGDSRVVLWDADHLPR